MRSKYSWKNLTQICYIILPEFMNSWYNEISSFFKSTLVTQSLSFVNCLHHSSTSGIWRRRWSTSARPTLLRGWSEGYPRQPELLLPGLLSLWSVCSQWYLWWNVPGSCSQHYRWHQQTGHKWHALEGNRQPSQKVSCTKCVYTCPLWYGGAVCVKTPCVKTACLMPWKYTSLYRSPDLLNRAHVLLNREIDLVKRETDLLNRETSLVNRDTDTVKWIFMYTKHAVFFTHGVLTQTAPHTLVVYIYNCTVEPRLSVPWLSGTAIIRLGNFLKSD